MSDSPSPDRLLVRKLDQAGWTLVADRVIRGLCHDLNGRLYSLSNLTYLLNSGGGDWSGVSSVVEEEVTRLGEAVRLLRLLPNDASNLGLLAPGEVLSGVARLVQVQPGLEKVQIQVEIPPGAPAVRMDETVFLRGMLLLITGAAEEASLTNEGLVKVTGAEGRGFLEIWPARKGDVAEDSEDSMTSGVAIPPNMETLVAGVLQDVGGGLTVVKGSDDGLVLQVSLPIAG